MAALMIDALELEDIEADQIEPEAALFGSEEEGLGLDSIDALEIVLAISRHYGVDLRADNENKEKIFRSLRSLTDYVHQEKAGS